MRARARRAERRRGASGRRARRDCIAASRMTRVEPVDGRVRARSPSQRTTDRRSDDRHHRVDAELHELVHDRAGLVTLRRRERDHDPRRELRARV